MSRQSSAAPRRAPEPDGRPDPRTARNGTPGEGVSLPFPTRLDQSFSATWRADLTAGLVVFLVALPLCLGVALASGAPLFSGIVTGIVGGLLVSRLSGSSLMVSGPAAGLTAIVSAAILQLGAFDTFLVAVVLAGALQLVLGVLRAGVFAYFIPTSVIRGMLAAIGLILILKQLPYALGAGIVPFESDSFAEPQGGNTLTSILDAARRASPLAVAIAIGSLALLSAWPSLVPERLRRALPAPLAVVLLGVAVAAAGSAFFSGWALPSSAYVQRPGPESARDLQQWAPLLHWLTAAQKHG